MAISSLTDLLSNKKFSGGDDMFDIYEIDIDKMKKDRKLNFYHDSSFPLSDSYYTTDNVSPNYLKLIDTINVDTL